MRSAGRYDKYWEPRGARVKLPGHWQFLSIKRLLSFGNGRDHKAVQVFEGGYPVYGSGGEFARVRAFLHDGESVLFGRKGTIDRPLYVNERFWTVDTMYFTRIVANAGWMRS